jgi:predicted secreted protein
MPGVAALGVVVQFGTTTGTATSATLTNVTNVSGFDADVEEIDVTSHDSVGRYREFVSSFIDAGEVSIDINYNPREVTHRQTTGGVMFLLNSGIIAPWKVKFPTNAGDSVSFMGFVKSMPLDLPYDDKMSATITVRVSGSATFAYGT